MQTKDLEVKMHVVAQALAQRLPLPLSQIYRHAHNAKTAQELHHCRILDVLHYETSNL
jgi:hypothetical protein